MGRGVWRNCISSVVVPLASYITEQMMWKLALNHANILSKQQTVGKMSDHELLSLDNSGSGWDNVLLAQKINKQGVVRRMFWYTFFEKIYSQGDVYPGLESRHPSLNLWPVFLCLSLSPQIRFKFYIL